MGHYTITVEFKLKPGAVSAFRRLVDINAAKSCRDEPGCFRFDVLIPKGADDTVFLYEIYDSEHAFQDHLKTTHFEEFNRLSAPLTEKKTVLVYDLVCEGSRY